MRRKSLTACLTVLLGVATAYPAVGAERTFQIIVHPGVRGGEITREILASIFLRDVQAWGDGLRISPVDQSMRAPVRADFTREVVGRPVDGMASFWANKIRSGVTPPVVKSSDAEVIAYVAGTEGAIGYVAAGVPIPGTVKVLSLVDGAAPETSGRNVR